MTETQTSPHAAQTNDSVDLERGPEDGAESVGKPPSRWWMLTPFAIPLIIFVPVFIVVGLGWKDGQTSRRHRHCAV